MAEHHRDPAFTRREPRPATFLGSHGRAWRLEVTDDWRSRGGVALWTAEVPGAHPAWRWYAVFLIHLRPLPQPEAPPAVLAWPTASHELQVWACEPLDMEAPGDSMLRGRMLSPQNLVVQLELPGDEAGALVVEDLVGAFVRGAVSPDTDFRRAQLEQLRAFARDRGASDRGLFDTRHRGGLR